MRARLARIVVLVVALAACGGPAGLDRDEAIVSSRTCTSLLQRAAVRAAAAGQRTIVVAGESVDLFDDPAEFYRVIAEHRGPGAFVVVAAAPDADRHLSAASIVALCRPDA